MGLVTSVVINS